MDAIRVLLIDDHPVVRLGLRSLLTQHPLVEVIGEAEDSSKALEMVARLEPDVALVDVRLGDANGIDLARQLHRLHPSTRIIILTSYDDEGFLLEAAQAGVHGYMLKSASTEVLAEAISAVHAGERRLSPTLAGKALGHLETLSRAQARSESGLSDQEFQLLRLIADGASTQEIAQILYWSERTIKRKTQDILLKLGATSRAQAVAEAYKRGLL
jgi:DNA-binding NarL/FixJ family response regulator